MRQSISVFFKLLNLGVFVHVVSPSLLPQICLRLKMQVKSHIFQLLCHTGIFFVELLSHLESVSHSLPLCSPPVLKVLMLSLFLNILSLYPILCPAQLWAYGRCPGNSCQYFGKLRICFYLINHQFSK